MLLTIHCPRQTFIGPDTSVCGCSIEVDVTIPSLALVACADSAEIPNACEYGHRFDQEEVADLRSQINAEVERRENSEPTQEYDFPQAEPWYDVEESA